MVSAQLLDGKVIQQHATRKRKLKYRWADGGTACLDPLWPSVPCRARCPAQPIESLVPRPRQHEKKRCTTARFWVARRRPTAARAACSAAGLMLHLAAGGVQHDHVQHQRSSPRGRGEPDHPATRHQNRAFIDDHRCSRGPLHRPVRTAARVRAATGHAAG